MKMKRFSCVLVAMVAIGTQAQNPLLPDAERQVMAEQGQAVEVMGRQRGEEAYAELRLRYHVPKIDAQHLRDIVRQRETRKACYDFIYPDAVTRRVRARMAVDSLFRDSIDAILIPFNRISGENISFALRMARVGLFDETQRQYLMQRALDIAHKLHANPRQNVWNEEMEVLRNTLDKEQLNSFFTQKNAGKATQEMHDAWKRLAEAGLSEQLDSVTDCAQAYMYFLERQKIKDLYRYYGTSQKKYLAELAKQMPLMVKMLDGLDKNTRIRKENEKNVGKEFVW